MDFFLGITNKCNFSCEWCDHRRLRNINPNYEMSKDEFNIWYDITNKAGYYFDSIDINGLGEPTLYSDIDFLVYMIIKLHKFTRTVNVLTNGSKTNIIKKIIPFCENINVSCWKNDDYYFDLNRLQIDYP